MLELSDDASAGKETECPAKVKWNTPVKAEPDAAVVTVMIR